MPSFTKLNVLSFFFCFFIVLSSLVSTSNALPSPQFGRPRLHVIRAGADDASVSNDHAKPAMAPGAAVQLEQEQVVGFGAPAAVAESDANDAQLVSSGISSGAFQLAVPTMSLTWVASALLVTFTMF